MVLHRRGADRSAGPPGVWPWPVTALAIGIALLLAMARLWTAAFTLVLATLQMIVTFDLSALGGSFRDNGDPWLLTAPVLFGLAALLVAWTGHLRLPTWKHSDRAT